MIVVTGATGALNGATVDHLLERLDPSEVAVTARHPDKAARFAERGVEVRQGDYDDPASLPAAFRGADQLLLVSPNDPFADGVALIRGAVEAAVEAGVGRLLYTSHQNVTPDTAFAPGRVQPSGQAANVPPAGVTPTPRRARRKPVSHAASQAAAPLRPGVIGQMVRRVGDGDDGPAYFMDWLRHRAHILQPMYEA